MTPDSHSLQNALDRTSLSEEEIYFILRFADRIGYDLAIKRLGSPWKRFRRLLIWVGGWERPELSQWDQGKPAWEIKGEPWPVSLFNHRITIFGKWAQFRCFGGWLTFANNHAGEWFSRIHWSPDGTPGHPECRHIADWSKRIS